MCQVNPSKPAMVKIKKVIRETPTIQTFFLDFPMNARLGQFVMIWIPGLDEKPFTLTAQGKECAVTVQCKGKFTQAMCSLKEGDSVGIRGAYGNGFSIEGIEKAIIISGGCGAAPILMLAEQLKEKGIETKIINGARTGNECLFKERLEKTTDSLYITTDDGSLGEKGYTTTVLERLLKEEKPDAVFGCGPEIMLKGVFKICTEYEVKCQLNLERFMRCGFGACGACSLGKWLVCKDGPVFTEEQLRTTDDFGNKALLKSGKNVSLKEYAEWRQ